MNETLEGEYEKLYAASDRARSQSVNTVGAAAFCAVTHMNICLYMYIMLYCIILCVIHINLLNPSCFFTYHQV
jgi:hypothetical protein